MAEEPVRIDTWLWCVRVFKTRAASKEACLKGRVRIDDEPVKPARRVKPGELVEARRGDRRFVLVVVETASRRLSATKAAEAYEDRSPPPDPRPSSGLGPPLPPGQRDRGAGRPTKKDRRAINRLRGQR
jgi:ribosome-associated heat shock protein Hsp15